MDHAMIRAAVEVLPQPRSIEADNLLAAIAAENENGLREAR
jgi:hypothetical protein